ncbi:hypothetical protein [Companilactobacillus mishanensis]|uniref:Uncharacterized protein n=1 Tax=Companilactobacillus mishanensis TaxID=2486008 RepID=A0A5P0ZF95_9LACO|nr:hypothetical protein [Companilactobacillus mishanensis]MQS51727.1 hypothetical protein [Companilactobacillus mishanensis]MQS88462.1 hypothetical protein [Companilactobacillus mishanensis]
MKDFKEINQIRAYRHQFAAKNTHYFKNLSLKRARRVRKHPYYFALPLGLTKSYNWISRKITSEK